MYSEYIQQYNAGTNLSHLCMHTVCMVTFSSRKSSSISSGLIGYHDCVRFTIVDVNSSKRLFKDELRMTLFYDTQDRTSCSRNCENDMTDFGPSRSGKPVYCDIVVLILKCIGFRYKKRPAKYTPALQKQSIFRIWI